MMGVLPLEYLPGQSAESLGLNGAESFDLDVNDDLAPRQRVSVTATDPEGGVKEFQAVARVDTPIEVEYLRSGGILHYMLRQMAG
jgi:aconitate hydratase